MTANITNIIMGNCSPYVYTIAGECGVKMAHSGAAS